MNILIFRNPNLKRVFIDGKPLDASIFSDSQKVYRIPYYGLTREGVNLDIELSSLSSKAPDIVLVDRSMGLNNVKGFVPYPKDIIPGSGRNSNTIQVVKRFSF
jgi:hypothetical protein